MKTSIAPNFSEGRAQRRYPSLSNSKGESKEISIVVIREPGSRGAEIVEMRFKKLSERGNIFSYVKVCK